MEAKVKEEIPDKDYTQPTSTERRKLSTASKERRSPEQDEGRAPSPSTGTAQAPPSPHHNGTAPASSEPGSPPAAERLPLPRLRRFLSALHHFAADAGADAGDRVRALVHSLVAGAIGVEEFQCAVAECTNYPLRASVPAFLRALLPPAQRDLAQRARRAKLTTLQYVRAHEHLVLDATDPELCTQAPDAAKRRAPDPYFDGQTNGAHDEPPPKRPPLLFPSPFACPLPAASNALFDYSHYNPYQGLHGEGFERRDGGISVRDVSSMNAPYAEPRAPPPGPRGDDEWRSINTMLNCILSMVEKTKRALAILQQRGVEPPESSEIKRAASDIMAAAVRQTEERVAEVRRRAEDAVNQVKRQALAELQRAVTAAESKALEGAKAEPGAAPPPPPARELSPNAAQQNCCWNCGRKAQETCSGCNAARYCGAFCQHKDWENHHQVCTGRDQKPTALLRTSPPASTTKPRAPTPSATNPAPTNERLAERLLTNPERILTSSERLLTNERLSSGSERLSLATLTTAQGLIGLGKK